MAEKLGNIMHNNPVKVALVQMLVQGGRSKQNIEHAINLIAEASRQGAHLALLPECMDLGWTHPSSLTSATEIPEGDRCMALMQAAKQHKIYVCAGLTEKRGSKIYNSAVLIGKTGELLLKHRKLNELDIGQKYYAQGDRLNVVSTELGTVGLMICADGFAQDRVLSRALGYMGADIILSPGAWAVPHDHDNDKTPYGDLWRSVYMPTAKEFSCPIIAVSNVGPITAGPWAGRHCIGCSLAIDAVGQEMLQGPYGVDAECILYVDVTLEPRPARGTGWEAIWKP